LTTGTGFLFSNLGSWVARSRVKKGVQEPEAVISSAVGAMLGLLAFILGFTFSNTSSRFSQRKQLVVQQANAIGTSYLRTSFIPEKQKTEIRTIYRNYTDLLLSLKNASDIQQELIKLQALHLKLWDQTASLVNENMDSELRSLFTSSVNDVIDLAGERETVALVFRIPVTLWTTLFVLFIICMFALGYQMGTFNSRRVFSLPLLAAALALVIVLISNMDSSSRQNFQASQKPLESLRLMMQENIR